MKHKSLSQMNREKIDRDRGTSPAELRSSGPKQRPEKVATTLGVSGESARRSVPTDDMKPMTLEEEYRNADVPIPNDLLNISNTEKFQQEAMDDYTAIGVKIPLQEKSVFEDKTVSDDYKSGGAYKAIMDMFASQLDDEKFAEHCKKFFKGKNE